MPEIGKALLLVQGQWVVDFSTDSSGGQMLPQEVAIPDPQDVLVIDVPPRSRVRCLHGPSQVGTGEGLIVKCSIALPTFGPGIQMLELDVENGRLQLVHAEIPANE